MRNAAEEPRGVNGDNARTDLIDATIFPRQSTGTNPRSSMRSTVIDRRYRAAFFRKRGAPIQMAMPPNKVTSMPGSGMTVTMP